ncbi:thiolase family protein [Subtercola frigoramans]|uniref:Acetyl-CoA C-acetyltransferase n=1 Tax=Subtercola frigoramans TaxID=120298 RepID=A0ABS2L361_9MICO|nr:thiolase family protein [Subtercola frigoramans]MBM7471539.1 acetyl-CoA C-acetyltransferase [Subtercola frigoramans]
MTDAASTADAAGAHRASWPVIVAARRSPITTKGRGLAGVTADELAAPIIRSCVDDAHRATGLQLEIADVLLGNCMGPGGNVARSASLAAGLDVVVPGMTLDRQCGSGLSAIISAAESIRAGDNRMIIAGGTESASTAPLRIQDGRVYARAPFAPTGFPDPEMGPAAEALARIVGIDRAAQDAYAERSHRLAVAATQGGVFGQEIVAVGGIQADDGPRAGISALLGRFVPLYPSAEEGLASGGGSRSSVTAGNSCRISDGAAAVALVPAHARGTAPGLALRAHATVGCDPALPGIGPVGAVDRLLADAGLTIADITAFEIVEAFAAQTLVVLLALGLAELTTGEPDDLRATTLRVDDRVCSDGGALALGHPWGASGAVGAVRLFSRLVRAGAPAGTLGISTAAIGGGMGVAALFEVVR